MLDFKLSKKILIIGIIFTVIILSLINVVLGYYYVEYNYSNYLAAGHKAWKSANALAKPPTSGPAVPNEIELTTTEYSQINLSDNVRASVASPNYRTFRFMFKLNQSANQIINLTIAWEGYTTGTTVFQRRVDLYIWNFTSNSWSASLANNNLSGDYWLRYTFTTGISNIVNSTNHIIFLVETEDPPGTQTFYTDMANVSVWYEFPPNVSLVSPPNGNITTSKNVNFTCNATDNIQLANITFYWNYSGTWQANGSVSVSGTSNITTFERTNLSNGVILWNCLACDNNGLCSFAPANWTVTVNYTNTAPQYSIIGSNTTTPNVNEPVLHYVYWTDNEALSGYIFSSNYSGSWSNDSFVPMTGTANWSNVTKNAPSTSGIYGWRIYAKDSENAWNVTEIQLINVQNQPPQITLNLPANNTVFNNTQNINFNFTATDDQNTTLSCSIYLDFMLNHTNSSVQNGTMTNFLISGISYGNHTWFINCTDGELSNVSETRYFTIADTIAPSIHFVSPTETSGSTIHRDYIQVNVTTSDNETGLKNITIYLYNSSYDLINSITSTTSPFFVNFTDLSEGLYYFNATAFDNYGNSNSTETRNVTIYLNKAPQITLNLPENNTQFNNTQDINFSFTVTDDQNTTLSCDIYLDGILNQTNDSVQNNTLTNFLINGIAYGPHNWSINCSDGELSNVSEIRVFSIVDTIAPIIYYNENTDANGTYNKDWIFINITAIDVNLDSIILEWNGINETFDNNAGNFYWENKTGLTDGSYTFKVYANDSFGNYNVTEQREIILDTTPPIVILNLPNNQLITGNVTIEFNCSAEDATNLSNISLWHNATGSWQENETKEVFGISDSAIFTKTFEEGNYLWSCSACDALGNCNLSFAENRTFTIDLNAPIINYVSPTDENNAYVSRLWTYINVTVSDDNGIDSCFLEWNGVNESMIKVGSGNEVYCFINKTSDEGSYIYNVYVNDTVNNFGMAGYRNITFDITPPLIENVREENITYNSVVIVWKTNEKANSTVNYGKNISLGNLKINTTFSLNHSILLTNLTPKTVYYYNITSCDFSGNCNTIGIFNFTTRKIPSSKKELPEEEPQEEPPQEKSKEEAKKEPSKEERREEEINCNITDSLNQYGFGECIIKEKGIIYFFYKEEKHKVIINKINIDNVDITISSLPVRTIIKLNESKFFDITGDNFEDVKITLDYIYDNINYNEKKAKFTIKIIKCECNPCSEWSKCIGNKQTRTCYNCSRATNFECQEYIEEKSCKKECGIICWYWLVGIFALVCLILVFIFWPHKKEDLESKLEEIERNLKLNGYDWKIKKVVREF